MSRGRLFTKGRGLPFLIGMAMKVTLTFYLNKFRLPLPSRERKVEERGV
jgi:hypothetical protein